MIDAQQEWAKLQRRCGRERRKRIGVLRKHQDRGLFELHPDRKARHHRGDPGAGRHRGEAQAFHIDAGEYGADDGHGDDHERPRRELHVDQRPEIGADHDRGAVGEIEPAHHSENQREAERQQGIGRADHHAVDRVLDEVDHTDVIRPACCSPYEVNTRDHAARAKSVQHRRTAAIAIRHGGPSRYSMRIRGSARGLMASAVIAHTSASSRSGERPDESPSGPKSHISSSSSGKAADVLGLALLVQRSDRLGAQILAARGMHLAHRHRGIDLARARRAPSRRPWLTSAISMSAWSLR